MNNTTKKKTLRPHQVSAVNATEKHSKGVIIGPTGSGKTLSQAEIVAREILKGGFRVIFVKTPRITLTNQISNEYSTHLFVNHLKKVSNCDFDSMLVHSGGAGDFGTDGFDGLEAAELKKQFPKSSLDISKIKNKLEVCRSKDIPLLIFTTYNSNETAYNAIAACGAEVDLDINDECHFLTQSNFNEIFDVYKPKRQYFFTATMRASESDKGTGMNNELNFGKIIDELLIPDAIANNLILEAHPSRILADEPVDNLSELKAIAPLVQASFNELQSKSILAPKLLVCAKGESQIQDFINSSILQDLVNDGVEVLTTMSNEDCITYNGGKCKATDFAKLMKEFGEKKDKKLIIVHCDQLSEGIDIPGLTGVLILRNMKLSKFLQTVGRVVRVFWEPKIDENGKVVLDEEGEPVMVKSDKKPCGHVHIPELADIDTSHKFQRFLLSMKEDGGVPSELMEEYIAAGAGEEETEEIWSPQVERKFKADMDFYISEGFDLDVLLDWKKKVVAA